ncbi:hypothetical protein [Aurantimonas sp. 22II-16-19i]|uniref:hypothetical protein n=1 Tax=Aurantimonas sp. 22II-16-19i TaxID=1317114 RepID=UPI0009F7B0A1|nr:hypothetical protein [Aurantimonas sp. 22II-16-19i]ORE89768.1 hypothetical protein ATO4_23857 [Aurantimonas sp. 22II-16-19i]
MKVKSIHPFPARMAPDLALVAMDDLPAGSLVLDPMMGSGTVIRQALESGHRAVGYDLDPLAVLMSKVWTTPVTDDDVGTLLEEVLTRISGSAATPVPPQWQDEETIRFIEYWFHVDQRRDLSCLAIEIDRLGRQLLTAGQRAALDVLKVGFSRIIITKEQAASLARDTSHSRPHRVATSSDYRVIPNFVRSVNQLRNRLAKDPPRAPADLNVGDARALNLPNNSVDGVITSPPYLNAIDYMRGHRMSLVWLGHSIPTLRRIRSESIGAERRSDGHTLQASSASVLAAMRGSERLGPRLEGIMERYAVDVLRMTGEIARVLKPGGLATFVVGNSCVKGRFIDNSNGVARAVELAGMSVVGKRERDLPTASRYLPVFGDALSKRMRTETVLSCRAA